MRGTAIAKAKLFESGDVCVAADNTLHIAVFGFAAQSSFVVVENIEGDLPVIGQEFGKRKSFDLAIDLNVERFMFVDFVGHVIIKSVAPARYGPAQQHAVELIAVEYEIIVTVGAFVDHTVSDLNVQAACVAVTFQKRQTSHSLVMVSGDVNYFCAVMGFSE